MTESNPVNIAGVVLRDEKGRYLMVQERQVKAYGLWNIPAGHQDPGETLEQTAIREAREEVGLEVELINRDPIYKRDNRKQKEFLCFSCQSN